MKTGGRKVCYPSIAVWAKEWRTLKTFLKRTADDGRTLAEMLPTNGARTRGRPRAVTLQWVIEAWIHQLYVQAERDPDRVRDLLVKLLEARGDGGPSSTRGRHRDGDGPPARRHQPGSTTHPV